MYLLYIFIIKTILNGDDFFAYVLLNVFYDYLYNIIV